MFEQFILGTIQGIAEWLPVSSEGLIFLAKTRFFGAENVMEIAGDALFLHFGTFLAALIYFRKDVLQVLKTLFNYKKAKKQDQKLLIFLIIATFISGVLGFSMLKVFAEFSEKVENIAKFATGAIGVLLLITAYLQIKAKKEGQRTTDDLINCDGVALGLTQAFAALPGLSRSGLTVSALLMRKFKEEEALKLSFLLSLPLVLAGNIILNLDKFYLNMEALVGLASSFVFGFLTIGVLLRLARKINFGWFVFGFGILMIISSFI